ncbi:hypothetical protein ZOSMA_44G01310 [Zostera marina]|uniref:Uncharacterized protein n=1 Tax=Zostera marina TaxID=29655 RepID=A0A0K9P3D8_ZOSMR|nr:hypothetical protein ZOSMA_44G01310 [Zostera marina]
MGPSKTGYATAPKLLTTIFSLQAGSNWCVSQRQCVCHIYSMNQHIHDLS